MANDEMLYEAVVRELERERPRKGLWAKAYAESGGIESAARALYMKLRVAQIAEELKRATEVEEEARRNALAAAADERQREIDAQPDTWTNNRILMGAGLFFLVAVVVALIVGTFTK